MTQSLKERRQRNKLYQRKWSKRYPNYRKETRIKCLNHYGGDPPECRCCGERTYQFLAIDHIKGKGNKERKKITKNKGGTIYFWLLKNNFPVGYQVLCHNCNLAKGFYGVCPHKIIS